MQRVLDDLVVPAVLYNARQDLVASNLMSRALFSPHFESDEPNLARFILLDRRARDYYADWPLACSRRDWADRDVHEHRTGRKVYRHPEVGEIDTTS